MPMKYEDLSPRTREQAALQVLIVGLECTFQIAVCTTFSYSVEIVSHIDRGICCKQAGVLQKFAKECGFAQACLA